MIDGRTMNTEPGRHPIRSHWSILPNQRHKGSKVGRIRDVKKFPRTTHNCQPGLHADWSFAWDGVAPDKIYPLDMDRAFKKLDELRPSLRAFYAAPGPRHAGRRQR